MLGLHLLTGQHFPSEAQSEALKGLLEFALGDRPLPQNLHRAGADRLDRRPAHAEPAALR